MHSSWNDTLLAFIRTAQAVGAHRVCLTTSCLSIGEDANVVTIKEAGDEVLYLVVNFNLRTVLSKDAIKEE